jgi:hypothetical protein
MASGAKIVKAEGNGINLASKGGLAKASQAKTISLALKQLSWRK